MNSRSRLQRLLDGISIAMMPLALAITLLLFLQWPLRDWIGKGSTQANDLAQWLFALYVAVAINHARRRGAHLVARPDIPPSGAGVMARLRRIGAPLCVLPWALFLVVSAAAPVSQSVQALELFPDSFNPGYFMIKVALMLMGIVMLLQSALDLVHALRGEPVES
ncbi:C4-dicarboxylate ABC transporter substrate-binding protein [Variovorax sp. Sphag1AA]|uniref:C4-dicarboxylate ABC transporter substrate-binding protein n=1 Tax=Variovorax sp. Sphag1AA TaxID=2587027 RepID=UPI0016188463|nr:C4-dicarboxylate ABC transporter substrate-binding protein [Variovorax sp. Sphag1AA]MBB3181431.1 TRAP-type C4-dicarboxylate transport system permease small subunit [Variovorax sp. Sphag1AA]